MFKGITDLPGIGKLVAEFRKLLLGLLRFRSEREIRRLKIERLILENRLSGVLLVQKLFAASQKCHCSPEELLQLVSLVSSPQQNFRQPGGTESEVPSDVNPKLLGE